MKKLITLLFIVSLGVLAFSMEIVYDDKGFPVSRTENTVEGTVISHFIYENNSLAFTSKFYEGQDEPFEIEYYIKSPINHSLVGVKRYTGTNLVGGDYLYSEETLFLNATDNLVFTTDFEIQSDGTITLTQEDGSVNTYSSDGLLIKKDMENSSVEYSYNEKKELVFSTTTDLNGITLTTYKEEKKFEETVIQKDLIASKTLYLTSGKITTVYEKGKPLANVTYYQDNKRVREIEYL